MNLTRHILLATDLSPASALAVEAAAELASIGEESRVTVVHVRPTEPAEISHLGGPPPPDEALKAQLKGQIAALREAALRDVENVETRLLGGRVPAEVICTFAKREGADLIVVGTHGRTGLASVLMGSVATEIVRQAPCPVLVVRVKQAASDE